MLRQVAGRIRRYSARSRCWAVLCTIVLLSWWWEWVRIYQTVVAVKTAKLAQDHPECSGGSGSVWTSIKSYLRWHLSWSHDPCEQYHQALLVDPFWEVNPLMALAAAVTRPCVTIVELASVEWGGAYVFCSKRYRLNGNP
ncbi:PREDICTED: chloride channel CLIC-like protein 1 [Branchiostoma belcheri]|uniref:Chloride channel CLIC-like protein 1 n=1 Tax=Branchiostoma belcheri TaxID=7741 RepID=A0A6P4ZRB7_BRABE|nr:PREDICTED: chloride channel CLIC-like protein 1 [Branchiostoma belcheri]